MGMALLFLVPAQAQKRETDRIAQQEIQKLAFITGNWEGTGWIIAEDGNRYNFDQTELVQFKLDDTALLIEGRGMREGEKIHDALAVVTFNHQNQNYTFKSWLNSGLGGEFKAELIDNVFYWYPGENMRYIIYINEKGQWYEKGEYNMGGDNWFQFFEMTLDKVE
ncbi:MAG: hypothetical protein EA361_00785 [Bacteroidetes bacterium]|nr:MAG: hypothetical protein EA361_00785 [Bacteroidota bacterium]